MKPIYILSAYLLSTLAAADLLKNTDHFTTWLDKQHDISINKMLANIGPDGERAQGVPAGTVLASPSRIYYYQWVRDAALVMEQVVRAYARSGGKDKKLERLFLDYIEVQGKIQKVNNPSGGFRSGGLGEPKFQVNASAYLGSWGRPQNDGPALRTNTILEFLEVLKETDSPLLQDKAWMKKLYDGAFPTDSVLKADLEYTANGWKSPNYNAWEEVKGLHLFTMSAQTKAMRKGAKLARERNDPGAADWYEKQNRELIDFLGNFFSPTVQHLNATLDNPSRTGLDCEILLSAIHGDDQVYPSWSSEMLISLHKFAEEMAHNYPINSVHIKPNGKPSGVALGRYIEDVYDGHGTSIGNPWFLCTSSASSVLYSTINKFLQDRHIKVDLLAYPFFEQFLPDDELVVKPDASIDLVFPSLAYNATIKGLFAYADSFLQVIRTHQGRDGSLSEQIDRETGFMRGVDDLTWSYASFVESYQRRLKVKDAVENIIVAKQTDTEEKNQNEKNNSGKVGRMDL